MFAWKQPKPRGKCFSCFTYIRYFFSQTSIHGFNHLSEPRRHYLEYILWSTSILLCIYGAVILSINTLIRYQENPTVISMERDRLAWNTSFPSITICPSTKLNNYALDEYIRKSNVSDQAKLREFIISLASATYTNFESVVNYEGMKSENYMDLLLKLQIEFKPSVTSLSVYSEFMFLQQTISELGVCYSFNSQLAYYNSAAYWKENKNTLDLRKPIFFIHPLDGEVITNIVNISTGFALFIHGPYEVADISSKYMNVENGFALEIFLKALSLYSSSRIRSLTPNQRKCRFYDESNLKRSPVYSVALCRMECRASLAQKLCGCVPHFYRKLDGDKICDVQGLHCLAKYKARFLTMKGECYCHPNCDESNYAIDQTLIKEWFLGSTLFWGMKEYPRMRLKRDIIFGFSDLLVSIGGMVGLFLGCSVLSIIEIAYLFTLRLFWYYMKQRLQNRIT